MLVDSLTNGHCFSQGSLLVRLSFQIPVTTHLFDSSGPVIFQHTITLLNPPQMILIWVCQLGLPTRLFDFVLFSENKGESHLNGVRMPWRGSSYIPPLLTTYFIKAGQKITLHTLPGERFSPCPATNQPMRKCYISASEKSPQFWTPLASNGLSFKTTSPKIILSVKCNWKIKIKNTKPNFLLSSVEECSIYLFSRLLMVHHLHDLICNSSAIPEWIHFAGKITGHFIFKVAISFLPSLTTFAGTLCLCCGGVTLWLLGAPTMLLMALFLTVLLLPKASPSREKCC